MNINTTGLVCFIRKDGSHSIYEYSNYGQVTGIPRIELIKDICKYDDCVFNCILTIKKK